MGKDSKGNRLRDRFPLAVSFADFFGGKEIKVTITLGVAQFDSGQGAEKCIQLADKALYEGKEHGRNKVILWTDDKPVENAQT